MMNLANLPTFRKWLMAQLHREDSVGVFARLSFTECMGFDEIGFYAWVEERKKGVILKAGIDDAKKEYAEAIEDLKRAKKTPTFPQWLNKREQNFEESNAWSRHRGKSEVTKRGQSVHMCKSNYLNQ